MIRRAGTRITWQEQIWPLMGVALIMGVIGAIVKPVVTFFSIPFILLTLGLFLLVINAWMLMLAGWVAGKFDLGFEVDESQRDTFPGHVRFHTFDGHGNRVEVLAAT